MSGISAMIESLAKKFASAREQAILKQVHWMIEQGILELCESVPIIEKGYPLVQFDADYTVHCKSSVELKLAKGYGKIEQPEDNTHRQYLLMKNDTLIEKLAHYEKVIEELHMYACGLRETKKT